MKENSNNSFLNALAGRKVYINLGAYDFRCGIDTLVATSTATCQKDFDDGALFSYCGKSKNQVRIVFWEGCGAWMISRLYRIRHNRDYFNYNNYSVFICKCLLHISIKNKKS